MKGLDGRGPARQASLALVFLVGALAGRSDAQVLYGSIVGNVADASKSAVPGAAGTIVPYETNLAPATPTRTAGSYTLSHLPPGPHTTPFLLTRFQPSPHINPPV